LTLVIVYTRPGLVSFSKWKHVRLTQWGWKCGKCGNCENEEMRKWGVKGAVALRLVG